MGFLGLLSGGDDQPVKKSVDVKFLHKHQCDVCPLNRLPGTINPHMQATGSTKPVIYMLGEAPGKQEDEEGVQFIGRSGELIRDQVPGEWDGLIRWNNCVRTRPPKNRTPTMVEIECCRPSIVKDIEKTKPEAIFGFGNVPLQWAIKENGITLWAGRRIPIKVGSHSCWFFPLVHPAAMLHEQDDRKARDMEFIFNLNLEKAFAAVKRGLPKPIVHDVAFATSNIVTVTGEGGGRDVETVLSFLDRMFDEKLVAHDYETLGLHPYAKGAKILSVALTGRDGTIAFPLRHPDSKFTEKEFKQINHAYKEFLYEAKCVKVAHNMAFELVQSGYNYGNEVIRRGRWGCSQSQAYLIDGRRNSHSLEFVCLERFGINIKDISGVDRKNILKTPLPKLLIYNGIDSAYHRHAFIYQADLLKQMHQLELYNQHMKRVVAAALSQLKGIPINPKRVENFYREFNNRRLDIEDEIAARKDIKKFREREGKPFRPSAWQDLVKFLDYEGIKVEKTNVKALGEVDHPVAKLVQEWRHEDKMISTYIEPVRKDSPDLFPGNLLHPSLATTRVITWRTSSNGPNIQNWPAHNEGKELRGQVDPGKGRSVVKFDYAGIQGRNVAMESLDKKLINYFWNRYDIHTDWTKRLIKRYPLYVPNAPKFLADKVLLKPFRQKVKNQFVFPRFFGAQPASISNSMDIPIDVAEDLVNEFDNEFPEVKDWQNDCIAFYKKHGYITGLTEHRRYAPISINELINSPIQADESLIVCNAMHRLAMIDDEVVANLMVHDDLTFIWDDERITENAELVIKEMLVIEFDWINVPLEVEMSVGPDWASCKPVGSFGSDTWDGKLTSAQVDMYLGTNSWDAGETWADDKFFERRDRQEAQA